MIDDMPEEREVEVHHLFAGTVVTGEVLKSRIDLTAVMRFIRSEFRHDMPIAVSPTVDRLFDIAYDEYGVSRTCQHILYQLADDAPLETAGILKLIHQNMMIANTGFLQNEIRVSCPKRFAERTGSLRQEGTIGFAQIAMDECLQRCHQLHIAAETKRELERVVSTCHFLRQFGSLQHLIGVAAFLAYAPETVFCRHLFRRVDAPLEPLVRKIGIAVVFLGIAGLEQFAQGYEVRVRLPCRLQSGTAFRNGIGIKKDTMIGIQHLNGLGV